ncbi:competence protein ComK [Metabacillus sp. GX 13764]|uniref:competence protein ComK n=1 Tax=Metabacillus kandeliae TaxID=2900151 RepID=UPI001E294B26|nr:competence protein ComK [Metabacillus kandeliae]MCD7034888.1 competence protein ComK [Metabacillus kandeliae]
MENYEPVILESYEANRLTMAILAVMEDGQLHSSVYEAEKKMLVKMKPMEIVERSCRYFGSSYIGRKAGTKDLLGITHKPPIVVDAANSIYLFPTTSSSRPQCSWISHYYIRQYETASQDNTLVTFTDGTELTLPISVHSFENQMYRTAQLRTVISSRIEDGPRKMGAFMFQRDSSSQALQEQLIRELNRY